MNLPGLLNISKFSNSTKPEGLSHNWHETNIIWYHNGPESERAPYENLNLGWSEDSVRKYLPNLYIAKIFKRNDRQYIVSLTAHYSVELSW